MASDNQAAVTLSAGTPAETAFGLAAVGRVEQTALATWVADRVSAGTLDLEVVRSLAQKYPGVLPADAMSRIATVAQNRAEADAPKTRTTTDKPKGTKCPLTRAQFLCGSKPVNVDIAGSPVVVESKLFSTGSFGWYHSGKTHLPVEVDGKVQMVLCQVGLTLTVVGSKDAEGGAA